jgi:DNA-binding NtrC family response regulator
MADRFLEEAGDMLDLATGARVDVRVLPALSDPGEARAWVARCARLTTLWHECLPPLLDFGFLAGGGRFEAYGVVPPPPASPVRASAAVVAFLGDCGLTTSSPARVDVRVCDADRAMVGVRLADRPAVRVLADLLARARDGAPARVRCAAPPGSGWRTFAAVSAREARRQGFVPVDAGLLRARGELTRLVRDRHVMLIDPEGGDLPAARTLLTLALHSARGHVLLVRVGDGHARTELRLSPFEPAALARLVHLWPADARGSARLERAAAQSGGWPGRLVATLRGPTAGVGGGVLRVAEARQAYIAPARVPLPCGAIDEAAGARVEEARVCAARLAARGRHAPAERLLRESAAACRRRDAATAAARLDLCRGWLLLSRGRTSAAQRLFRDAHATLEAVDDIEVIDAAGGVAAALIADGAFEAGEAVLRAAQACTTARQPEGRSAAARHRPALWLARCLYWQGRLEAAQRAANDAVNGEDPGSRAMALGLLGRVALARHDLPNAGRAASLALAELRSGDLPVAASLAHEVLLEAHGRLGDAAGVALHGTQAIAWGTRARRPLRVLHARASLLEARHRCGRRLDRRLLVRLARAAARPLPALTRARLASVLARVHPDARERAAWAARVTTFVQASGARLLLPDAVEPPGARLARDTASLLEIAERHPDPATMPARVCEWLSGRLDAAEVAALDARGARVGLAGGCRTFESAARILATRQVQPPWTSAEGLEAGAPIIYHRDLVGLVVVRWVVTQEVDPSVTAVLTTAAACLAPALRAHQDRLEIGDTGTDDGSGASILGRSPAIVRLRDAIDRAARSPFPVLIAGESGAGKELVGRAIHAGSPRRLRAFCAINCAALMDDLLEAELFGHARGAFTGAHADRPGLFEQADGGTLFLDEVSELSPRAQAKLLRVLQEGEIRRVGENAARRVDVRIVAASNRVLDDDAERGRFRRDLLFRLAVVRLFVPPLRDRRDDIALLAVRFWRESTAKAGSRATLTAEALGALARYEWPGNVRELQNVMAALAVQVPRGRVGAAEIRALTGAPAATGIDTLHAARRTFEREFVRAALARSGGRQARAARELGLTRQGLAKLLRRLAIEHAEDASTANGPVTSVDGREVVI